MVPGERLRARRPTVAGVREVLHAHFDDPSHLDRHFRRVPGVSSRFRGSFS